MKSLRLQAIASDFTACWTKFMVDGQGEAFIKASSDILGKVGKGDGSSITKSVLSKFIVPANKKVEVPEELYEHHGTKVEPTVKVVLGCLSAIRSLQGVSSDGMNRECLHSVLVGADNVAKSLVAKTRTPEEEALLTEELRSLFLSLESSDQVSSTDGLGADVPAPQMGARSSFDIMNSYAQSSEIDGQEGVASTGSGGDAVDVRLTAKARASLTFGAIRMFPFLSSLPVGPDAVNGFLTKLTKTGNWGSAVHLVQLYPNQVSLASFEALLSALYQAQEWDATATLLLAVRKLLHAQNAPTQTTEADVPVNVAVSVASAAVPAVVPRVTAEDAKYGPFLLELSPTELRQKVVDLVQLSLELNVQAALTAAKKLANDYKLTELTTQIEDQDMLLKFQNDINKNKWQMTIQALEKKSEHKRLKFYNLLLQNERYLEAAEAYRSLNLRETDAVLATRAQLDAQTLRHKTDFLCMAPALLDSVLVINHLSSLQTAARELGLLLTNMHDPVEGFPSASVPVRAPSASMLSLSGFKEGAHRPSLESPETAVTAEKVEKVENIELVAETAVRSVPFTTLLQQLRKESSLHSTPSPAVSPAVSPAAGQTQGKVKNGPYFNGRYRQVVGLDGEWRALMRRDLSQFGCSILQIAAPNRVYILDFRTLCPDLELQPKYSRPSSAANSPRSPHRSNSPLASAELLKRQTRNFLHNLMSDPEVLKVGWDFLSEDIRMLRKNAKGDFINAMAALNSYLEVKDAGPFVLQQEARVHKQHQKHKEDTSTSADPASTTDVEMPKVTSLSSACEEFLGKPLLKFEQMSNWDRRPLRKAQVQYASLDAHATLALLDATLSRAGVPVNARLGIADVYLSPESANITPAATTVVTPASPVVTPNKAVFSGKKTANVNSGTNGARSPRTPYSSRSMPKASPEG